MSVEVETWMRERMAASLRLSSPEVAITGRPMLESPYPVAELATASVATTAAALSELVKALGSGRPLLGVDRERAARWFSAGLRPVGWEPPSPWDPIAGNYRTSDGWIRLHTNAPHHRRAALAVLGIPDAPEVDAGDVGAAVAGWAAQELESAIVAAGGCAAELRTPAEWAAHPQGAAVGAEPLIQVEETEVWTGTSTWAPRPGRPLAGLRVLDLTRVLAGPVSTRLLAGLGADVLRIDPPDWDEPGVVPDMTLGKRCARLDARTPDGRARLMELLADADVLVHGYRAGALDSIGIGEVARRRFHPGLVDVSLTAYGHTGPWASRRGFDSLVQMSSGIAGVGIFEQGSDAPTPLPVQALDHATGWLMAAAVLAGLVERVRSGHGMRARLSLARTAVELEQGRAVAVSELTGADAGAGAHDGPGAGAVGATAARADAAAGAEPPSVPGSDRAITTPWGSAEVLAPPLGGEGLELHWALAPRPLGSDAAEWAQHTA